jgi:hypothetical protein
VPFLDSRLLGNDRVKKEGRRGEECYGNCMSRYKKEGKEEENVQWQHSLRGNESESAKTDALKRRTRRFLSHRLHRWTQR